MLEKVQYHYNMTAILILFTTFCVTWLLLKNVFYKMNYKFPPGPYGIPLFGVLPFLGEEPYKALWDMKKKYGDVIGCYFGREYTVVLNDFAVAKEVLSNPDAFDRPDNFLNKKPNLGFNADNGSKWVEQRRFSMSAARNLGLGRGNWEDTIMEAATDFSHSLHKYKGQSVEISDDLITSLATNVVNMVIGRKLDPNLEEDKIQLLKDFNEYSLIYVGPSKLTSIIPFLRRIFEVLRIGGYHKSLMAIRKFSDFIYGEIARHRTSPELQDVNDFINIYLEEMQRQNTVGNEHNFSEFSLEGSMNVLFLGSSDTAFSSLQWLLRLMAKYPQVQDRVHQEVMREIPNGVPRFEDRKILPYTFAAVMEGQRIASIVPLSGTRKATHDIQVGEYTIPHGAYIMANLWGIHHDPAYWKDPFHFDPERFILDNKVIEHPKGYAPFSMGRRNCPGETVGLMTIMAYLTTIIKEFEVVMPPGEALHFEVINGLVSKLKPQNLCFKPRS